MAEARQTQKVTPRWDDEGYYVSLGVHKSRRYHATMREFYKRMHDNSLALTAVSGSAAFISMFGQNATNLWPRIFSGIVAVASTLDLVFDFSKKADRHEDLCRRFTELAAQMQEKEPSPAEIDRVQAARIRIEADEPTERRIVELWAMNDECRSRGLELDELVPLSWLQRTPLMYFVRTWGEAGLERRILKRKRIRNVAAAD